MNTGMEGLRTDQAPPLSIPASFFLAAPVALVAAGVLLVLGGAEAVSTRWSPVVLAVTHLLTLGYLGSIMLGALYQMVPVVAGTPVPWVGLSRAVLGAWAGGVGALVAAFLTGAPGGFVVAPVLLGAALVAFGVPVGIALGRAPTRSATVWGMRAAGVALLLVAAGGIALTAVRGGWAAVPLPFGPLVDAHAGLGTFGWVGGLIVAVSWQVVPMFYLAPAAPKWSQRLAVALAATTTLAVPFALALGVGSGGVVLLLVPAAGLTWVVHPVLTARAIVGRRRKRADFSLRFWLAGLAFGGVAAGLAPVAWAAEPRGAVALGWAAAFGWAGLITHGMLSRIVPFLVWFHRYSPRVGLEPVPSMRDLLPESRLAPALGVHAAAAALGVVAVLTGVDALVRLTGALVVVTGVLLAANLIGALRRRPGAPAASGPSVTPPG